MKLEYLIIDVPAKAIGQERAGMLSNAGEHGWQLCGVLNLGPVHQYNFSREKSLVLQVPNSREIQEALNDNG